MHYCDKCPGVFRLQKHAGALFDDVEEDDTLNVRQWSQQSGCSSLITIKITICELIERNCEQVDKVRTHHYLA